MKKINGAVTILLARLVLGMVLVGFVIAAVARADSRCMDLAANARTIMEARQAGVPIEHAYDLADGDSELQRIVIEAYKRPRYMSQGFQRAEVDEFVNRVFTGCVQP